MRYTIYFQDQIARFRFSNELVLGPESFTYYNGVQQFAKARRSSSKALQEKAKSQAVTR